MMVWVLLPLAAGEIALDAPATMFVADIIALEFWVFFYEGV